MTNVYWVHMPRNISRPPLDDGNASSSNSSPEAYLTNESLSVSASCTSKKFMQYILNFNAFIFLFHFRF